MKKLNSQYEKSSIQSLPTLLVGKVIRDRRESLGLSREALIQEIADLTGEILDKTTLYRLEKGTLQPRDSTLQLIEQGLDFPSGLLSALCLPFYEIPDWVLANEIWKFHQLFSNAGQREDVLYRIPALVSQLSLDLMQSNDEQEAHRIATEICEFMILLKMRLEAPPANAPVQQEEPVIYAEISETENSHELEDDEILMGIKTLRMCLKDITNVKERQNAKTLLSKFSAEYQRRLSADLNT